MMELQIAHVIFVSDQASANKSLERAQPNKALDLFSLNDANQESAIKYLCTNLSSNQLPKHVLQSCIEAVGGRLTDLESLVQKIRAGRTPIRKIY